MRELDELRPAPRRTPTAVLWLMGALVVGGSGLLVWTQPTSANLTMADADHRASTSRAPRAAAPSSAAKPATAAPALGNLQVP